MRGFQGCFLDSRDCLTLILNLWCYSVIFHDHGDILARIFWDIGIFRDFFMILVIIGRRFCVSGRKRTAKRTGLIISLVLEIVCTRDRIVKEYESLSLCLSVSPTYFLLCIFILSVLLSTSSIFFSFISVNLLSFLISVCGKLTF